LETHFGQDFHHVLDEIFFGCFCFRPFFLDLKVLGHSIRPDDLDTHQSNLRHMFFAELCQFIGLKLDRFITVSREIDIISGSNRILTQRSNSNLHLFLKPAQPKLNITLTTNRGIQIDNL
jgi:hypothetical protein